MRSQAIIAAFGLPVVALAFALSTGCAAGSNTPDSGSAAGSGGGGPSGASGQGSGSQGSSGSGAGNGSGSSSSTGVPVMNNPNCNGGCATGQDWKWNGMPPGPYIPGAVIDGPMPPTQGGGSGLDPNGTPLICYGGNFGDYSDNASFCDYIANRFRYLENECGNFNTAFLTVDPSLAASAQAEAEAVAGGKCPDGPQSCGNWAEMLYIDGWQGNYLSRSAIYTAPESNLIVGQPDFFNPGLGNYPKHACQFTGEYANVMLYHYCVWEGTMMTDPSTQPKRVGCGTAVDKSGVTWRVVQLGK